MVNSLAVKYRKVPAKQCTQCASTYADNEACGKTTSRISGARCSQRSTDGSTDREPNKFIVSVAVLKPDGTNLFAEIDCPREE